MSAAGSSTMPSGSKLQERLEVIDGVEQKVTELMKHAQACIAELSRDKQISKTKMDEHSVHFKRCLNSIESDLSTQMQYLSHVCVGTAHQGTTFASQQNIMLAEQAFTSLREELKAIKRDNSLPYSEDGSMDYV